MMKKIISYLSIATWVLGVFSLWFSLTNGIWTDFQKLGFVAQSVCSKDWLEWWYWWKVWMRWWEESVACGNWIIEEWEECELYTIGSWSNWSWLSLMCLEWTCVNCKCVKEDIVYSCKTFYTVYSYAPSKVIIQVQLYQNGSPVSLPLGFSYWSPVNVVRTNYTPLSLPFVIWSNGQWERKNVPVWSYSVTWASIITKEWVKISCSSTAFVVQQNPKEYCWDWIQQARNGESCDYASDSKCDGVWYVCNNQCKCVIWTWQTWLFIDLELKTEWDYPQVKHIIKNNGTQQATNFYVSSYHLDPNDRQWKYRTQTINVLNAWETLTIVQGDIGTWWVSELCWYSNDIDSTAANLWICNNTIWFPLPFQEEDDEDTMRFD
jgi:hypothetical protein